ncbi:hypothetical protein BCR39DRAFT_560289 [Naematelia encephala]|uniref:RING-type domain-containing protein n=1 Tax=Naematelia encephala TaxID=71784 RepID=A0A1Y2AWB8_9TREE|nr:hypothetical protein BCR39DRAFT_560289 [Naematelia encephala]
MISPSPSPSRIPLPPSPDSRRSSLSVTVPPPAVSPRTVLRPRLDRNTTSVTLRQPEPADPFHEGSTISVNQPVGSLSISPSSRDVCLASRKGLYILDLANLNNAPRFIPQGGTWQIADCQWSPHPSTSNLILSTSSQKLLVWDLSAQKCLHRSIDAHSRAITDINWHARNPNLMATVSMDAGIRGWDLRASNSEGPFMRLCAWGQAGTQVKWNRQHEHVLATAHGKEVLVWDNRKGSVPTVVIKAHDAKIYGIDWDRRWQDKLVTCSLDKTIKSWTITEDKPTSIITTTYPVWRARNLPFGPGVLALPQRGEKALEMFRRDSNTPVETFEGHDDVVKEFVWRTRGGDDPNFDDREFQLVTWSKDRTLRIWPVGREITERVGFKYGAPINVLVSRRGAPDITYTRVETEQKLSPPVVNPSGIARQKTKVETGMTRGGGKARGMDQLEWLTKVVKNKASPDSSALQSRIGSKSRTASRATSTDRGDLMTLKDEVVEVNRTFPRPRINFEKIDLHHRKLTISMNGPWANGDRMAFMRIHWSLPPNYPYSTELPTFELERNPTVSPLTRQKIIATIKELRAKNRQCLVLTTGFLLGAHERVARRLDVESDSESEKEVGNVPMLIRTSGATFGPNGQLVCFFPKQTVLPRTRAFSRSPSVTRDQTGPLLKAMSELSRLENPHQRAIRIKRRLRRHEALLAPVQAGSTCTIHNVSALGYPDAHLAKLYSTSVESNLYLAFERKRLDHAQIWATLQGLLTEPPPPYSRHPPLVRDVDAARREREIWERGIARKKLVLDKIFATLIHNRDVQMLALVSIILLIHTQNAHIPPRNETSVHRSPEQDYFTLPRVSSQQNTQITTTPTRHRSLTSMSPGFASYRTSGWSQILNPSSISLRGAITPRDRTSFGDLPFAKTPSGMSIEESPSGLPIPKRDSPRIKDRPRHPQMASASPTLPLAPQKSASSVQLGSDSGPTGSSGFASRISFVARSDSPRRHFTQGVSSVAESEGGKRKICSVRIEVLQDETPDPSLLPQEMRPSCEGWKIAYADFLLRFGLLGVRAEVMQYRFVDKTPVEVLALRPKEISEGLQTVCVSCAGTGTICSNCARKINKPICTLCRLPIKGLAMCCHKCYHRTHASCRRTSTTRSCPSCPCECTYGFPLLPIPATDEDEGSSILASKGIGTPSTPTPSALGIIGDMQAGQNQNQHDVGVREGLLGRARLRGLQAEGILGWRG